MTAAPSPPSPDSVGLAELQGLLLSTSTLDDFLTHLVSVAARTLTGDGSVGLTLRSDGRLVTAASSEEVATRVDEVQSHQNEGPCLHAFATGAPVDVANLATETRFGAFTANALALGVRSVLSIPLIGPDGDAIGALSLYAFRPEAYGQADRERAEMFAGNAAGAVTVALRMADQTELSTNLRAALDSRAVIDQALGIVMGQQRCSVDEAFAILRAASQNRNLKIRGIAGEIVESVSGQPPPAQAHFRA